MISEIGQDLFQMAFGGNVDFAATIKGILDPIKDNGLVSFDNSVKHSYLAGEMTNFGAGLTSLTVSSLLPEFDELKQKVEKLASDASVVLPANMNQVIKGALSVISGQYDSNSSIVDDTHS